MSAVDDNTSDFDNSDEDLASLLADDDDIFGKRNSSALPSKKFSSDPPGLSPKKTKESPKHETISKDNTDIINKEIEKSSFSSSSPSHALNKNVSKDASTDQDALSNFLSDKSKVHAAFFKAAKTSSPIKSGKQNDSGNNESDFLDDLTPKFPVSENQPNDKLLETKIPADDEALSDDDEEEDDDDDILKTLGLDEEEETSHTSEKKGSSSFLDEFIKKLSPKHEAKKPTVIASKEKIIDDKKEISAPEDEEDILGNYTPTAPKKNESISDELNLTLQKKRGSLLKQVSFKDTPESPMKEKESISPVKIPQSNKSQQQKSTNETSSRTKRLGKMDSSKDDMDWLTFFKESPKKSSKTVEPETKKTGNATNSKQMPLNQPRMNRRKSSSADWLGLNEPETATNDDAIITEGKKMSNDEGADWLKSNQPIKPRRPRSTEKREDRKETLKANQALDSLFSDTKLKEPDNNHLHEQNLAPQSVGSSKLRSDSRKDFDLNTLGVTSDVDTSQQTASTFEKGPNSLNFKSKHPDIESMSSELMQQRQSQAVPSRSKNPLNVFTISQLKEAPHENIYVTQQAYQEAEKNAMNTLQMMLNNSMLEKEQLVKSSETMKLMYEEKLKTLENLYKDKVKSSEESFKNLETSLRMEFEAKIQALEDRLKTVQDEKKELESSVKGKLETIEKEHQKEIQRLKDLHSQAITVMKQDHEDALQRLKRLKEQEIEAVLSTQSHSRSLQHLTEQLEARTSELASLQARVEERTQAAFQEKQALLDLKERDLKALQSRLQKQLEEGDEERTRLQQLVLRLESRLQKYTMEGEEDRWEVQQMKAKLSVQQKYLDEEHKMNLFHIEKEKEKLRLSQDSLLHEQKTILLQLAQERQQLTQEKINMESLTKRIKEEEARLNIRKLKEESLGESQKRLIQEEESKLYFEKDRLKQESYQLERERESLEREKLELKNEREKFNELRLSVKRKADEVEEMALSAREEREQARFEHAAALKIKAEHHSRMQQISQQMQMLMEKQRELLAEKDKLSEEKLELERKKNSILCNRCKLSIDFPVTGMQPVSTVPMSPARKVKEISNHIPQSTIDPGLVVWYISAQKDREFLQEQLSFLRSLKDSNYEKINK
ncbi:Fas-binding factor 1-like protein, partial [Stegodyphus mimosarum]